MVDHNDSASESDSDTWYWYDATDRSKQLLRLEQDCDLLAQLLDESDPVIASVYRAVAADAKNLNDPPIEHADLKLLVGRVPTKPPWLNPREVSWNMPRTEPMLQFADLRSKLDATMLELRAIATSDLQGSADDGPGKRLHHSSSSEESPKIETHKLRGSSSEEPRPDQSG